MERKRLARHSGFDRDYWLCRCEGFRVDSAEGRIGFVRELRFDSRQEGPDLLAVRAGLFGTRLLLVPVEEVEEILPNASACAPVTCEGRVSSATVWPLLPRDPASQRRGGSGSPRAPFHAARASRVGCRQGFGGSHVPAGARASGGSAEAVGRPLAEAKRP